MRSTCTSMAVRRKRSSLRHVTMRAVCCLAVFAALVSGQDRSGSSGGGGVPLIPQPQPPAPTSAPTTHAPALTTSAPTTAAPVATTLAPTLAPKPTTVAPDVTVTPSPDATTVAPTATPKPSKTFKNVTKESARDSDTVVAPPPTLAAAPVTLPTDTTTTDALAPASTPGSNGNAYGAKKNDSDSSTSNEATTKATGGDSKTAIQFAVVAAGVLGVVLAVALSVHFHQKRQALDYDDDKEDYLDPPKRPTVIDVHHAPPPPLTTNAPASTTAAFNDFATPQAAVPAWRQSNNATVVVAKPPPVTLYNSATEFNFDEELGYDATVLVGETHVDEEIDGTRVTVNHITECRGQSEHALEVGNLDLNGVPDPMRRGTTASEMDEGFANTQMFAFSDSGSEADRDSSRTLDASHGPSGDYIIAEPSMAGSSVEIDVDDDMDILMGRSTRASSLLGDDMRMSDFTVGHTSRLSRDSSIADFHDSMVDRPSELDEEEFEV